MLRDKVHFGKISRQVSMLRVGNWKTFKTSCKKGRAEYFTMSKNTKTGDSKKKETEREEKEGVWGHKVVWWTKHWK